MAPERAPKPPKQPSPSASPPPSLLALPRAILTGTHPLSKAIPPALWLLDALLCALVTWKVPYTEIDWVAYMEQVEQVVAGERDYAVIKGGTGPLVYPAAHVYLYTGLWKVTDGGRDVLRAQVIFGGIYMLALGVVMACYRKAKAPPYLFPLLILSKRLHSIFVLRLFNDGPAALFLFLAILLLQTRNWTLGMLAYAVGLGTKMTLLLSLPAVGVVLLFGRGLAGSLRMAWLLAQVQLSLGVPFLAKNWRGYLGRAFDLRRVFLWEWTVNWRWVGEETFSSPRFRAALLVAHIVVLSKFFEQRWMKLTGRSIPSIVFSLVRLRRPFSPQEEARLSYGVTPEYVLTTILTANVLGLLFARSLHYQFYAYLAWATPYLLWRAFRNPAAVYVLWAAQEWAWNVFPSTAASSGVVVGVLAVTVLGVWWRTGREVDSDDEGRRGGKEE